MNEIIFSLGITAALLHGFSFWLYNISTKLGKSEPNATTWSIWVVLATINAFTFLEMSGDLVATLQFITGSIACVLTFFYVLVIGKLKWPKGLDWFILALSVLAIIVWLELKNAKGANMIAVFALIFSFVPTFKGVLYNPFKEAPLPWILWSVAYIFTTLVVVLGWKGEPFALVSPIVLILAHGSIAVLSSNKRKVRFQTTKKPINSNL